ncbi:MAG: ABC transporter ATP-binding protein [Desulfotomaculum sp.]|nr:ABC transporter ATP-binding protein [Desulfotomaculum sp.]
MEAVIVVKDLVKNYGDFAAVKGLSFEVYENEIFGIIGPNGAGKTTTVECLEGLRAPSGGSTRVLGLDPQKDGQKLRQLVGIQLQEGKLPERIKTREALELFAGFYQRSLPANLLLAQVELLDKSESHFDTLSGGQKQRLFIALSLVNDPQVVFFDELTTGLDPHARRAMWELVSNTRNAGKSVVLVTHFMEEAERLCDRVAIVDGGKIVALDTPAKLIKSVNGGLKISFLVDNPAVVTQFKHLDINCESGAGGREIVIRCVDEQVIGAVIRILGENNCRFHNFVVSRPNLEDVFLAITGKEMRE